MNSDSGTKTPGNEPLNQSDMTLSPDQSPAGQQSGRRMGMILGKFGSVKIRLEHYRHIDLDRLKKGGYR